MARVVVLVRLTGVDDPTEAPTPRVRLFRGFVRAKRLVWHAFCAGDMPD